jgi:hypothetical protein
MPSFSSFGINVPPNDPSGVPTSTTPSLSLLPNALRMDTNNTISTLRFKEGTYDYFYLAEQQISYTTQNINLSTTNPITNITSSLCPILTNVAQRQVTTTSTLSRLYIVPILAPSGYYVFGTPISYPTSRTVLYDSPAYYLTNIGIDNIVIPNVTQFDSAYLKTGPIGQTVTITDVDGSIGDILSTNPSLTIGNIGTTKTINLQRISTSIVHNSTIIFVTTPTGPNVLNIYTTVATEFPYRPTMSALTAYTFTPTTPQGGYTFDDTTFTTKYPKYLAFRTNEEATVVAGKVSVGPTGAYFLDSTTTYNGILPTTMYVVPYASKTYNSEILLSYASSAIPLNTNGYVPPTLEPPIRTPNTNTSMPYIQFQFRRGTTAEWLAVGNGGPVLAAGEIGVDTTTNQFKLGDGVTRWVNLPYGGIKGADGVTGPTGPPGNFSNSTVTGTVSSDYYPVYYSKTTGQSVLKM